MDGRWPRSARSPLPASRRASAENYRSRRGSSSRTLQVSKPPTDLSEHRAPNFELQLTTVGAAHSQLSAGAARTTRIADACRVPESCYGDDMSGLRARVQNGRLVLDAPTALPEGTVLDLVVDDEGDDLDDAERAELDDAISRAWDSVLAGGGRSAEEVLESLRKR
jgi:hypothetical protein